MLNVIAFQNTCFDGTVNLVACSDERDVIDAHLSQSFREPVLDLREELEGDELALVGLLL